MGKLKKIAILQSNYIPWKGYFDLINYVDEFILFDDMQYTKRDWRNRNRIKTPNGLIWLTIPVRAKGKYYQLIKDTQISDPRWGENHWSSILWNYKRAQFFKEFSGYFEALFLESNEEFLSKINHSFIQAICEILSINTEISWSMDYSLIDGKTERLVDLCLQAGGTHYISGPAAKNYIDDKIFKDAGIGLEYFDYSGYLKYPQIYLPFEHGVSVLDLIFNTGFDARKYMLSFGEGDG